MKKSIGIFTVLMFAFFVLTSCGRSDDGIVIRFSWWGGDARHADTINAVNAFMERYPHIRVEVEPAGWTGHFQNQTQALMANTEADLMQVNFDWLPSFSPTGARFLNLRQLDIDLSGFDPGFLTTGETNGVLQGIPHGANAYGLAINRTVWERFGAWFPEPDGFWTWDDVLAATELFPPGYYLFATDVPMYFIVPIIVQRTGVPMLNEQGIMNFTVEDFIFGLNFYQNLVNRGVLPSRAAILDGGDHEFFTGQRAGEMIWTGGVVSRAMELYEADRQELIMVPFPRLNANVTTSGVMEKPTMLFSISRNTRWPAETAMLLDFIINDPEGVRLMGLTRGTPANTPAVAILEESGQLSGLAMAAYIHTTIANGINHGPVFEMFALRDVYENLYEMFALGMIDVNRAASDMVVQIQEAADRVMGRM
ncbi:MAG: extracellular solute-binding protein [Treponema sp.]|nr:extracellular solute-binding protein [Treponema sp.]